MRPVVFALLTLAVVARAFAALEWESTTVQVDAGPLDEKIDVVFRFTNTGANAVTIAQTHASCGCTVATLDKKTFAPGEAGELRAVYTVGDGVIGLQEKTVTVETADSPAESFLLTLRVNVPGLWEVQPKFVKWEHGEAPTAKTVTIRALHPEIAKPVAAEARDTRFAAEVRTAPDESGVYVVSITPTSTEVAMFTSVIVATDAPGETKRVVQLYAVVR
jgi:Protein of unknown function (DUF1573)